MSAAELKTYVCGNPLLKQACGKRTKGEMVTETRMLMTDEVNKLKEDELRKFLCKTFEKEPEPLTPKQRAQIEA